MFKCVMCGNELHWYSDFNLDEVFPGLTEGSVSEYCCAACGLDYQIAMFDAEEFINIEITKSMD